MNSILQQGTFFSPSKQGLTIHGVIDELRLYMQEKPHYSYEIIVGCDSSACEDPQFPLAVVALRKGAGGRFFLQRVSYPSRKFYSLQERILHEVYLSCELALFLREELNEKIAKAHPELRFAFQYIHADVGEQGPTKDMIKEVVGLIRGNGFEPMIKPLSFAASSVADRYS